MFAIDCPTCATRWLVGPRSIVSLANTVGGPVALARCLAGHLVVHSFRAGTTHPTGDKV